MKVTDFTPAEAQALVRLAESAPLQNMAHAKAVNQLLEKFAHWYDATQQKTPEEMQAEQSQQPQAEQPQ